MEDSIMNEPWYHGQIARSVSEDRLMRAKPGSFLFRKSESRVGLSLSIRIEDKVKHYMVTQKPNDMFAIVGKDREFESIHHLVRFHSSEPLSSSDGQALVEACPEDMEMDEDSAAHNPYVDLLSTEVDHKALEEVRNMSKAATLKSAAKVKKPSYEGVVLSK